jgi:cation:H+ antiporter
MLAAALLFASSLAIILVGCHVFTNGVEWLGKRLGVSDGVVGSIFAGVGTALPETMIPLVAILFGGNLASQQIGVGAIVGAPFMLSTLTLPLGALGVFVFTRMGRRTTHLDLDTRQMDLELRLFLLAFSITMLAAFVPWMPARWAMALFLVLMYAHYVRTTLRAETNVHEEEVPPLFLAPRRVRPAYALIALQVVLALIAIVGGAHLFVDAVADLATGVGISPYQRKDQMAVGNITGAMVFQSTFPAVIGILGTPWLLERRVFVAGGMSITATATLLFLLRMNGGLRPVHLLFGGVFYLAYAAYVLR